MAAPKVNFSRQTLSTALVRCAEKMDPTMARRVCKLLIFYGILQRVLSLPHSDLQSNDSVGLVDTSGFMEVQLNKSKNGTGEGNKYKDIGNATELVQKVFGWDFDLNNLEEMDIVKHIQILPMKNSKIKQGNNFIRSQIGSVSLVNLPGQSMRTDLPRDRRAAMPVQMLDIDTDKNQDFLFWWESRSNIDLQAENTNFDMSMLNDQMESIKEQLQHFSATKVTDLPVGMEVSTRYNGWRKLSQTKMENQNLSFITYGTIRDDLDFDDCFAYCKVKGARMVQGIVELKQFYRSFSIRDQPYDYRNFTAILEKPGFHLYYDAKPGTTYHLTPEEAERKQYRDFVYDGDIFEVDRYNYVKLDAEIQYENKGHRMANVGGFGHYFGTTDLSKNCADNKDKRLYKLEEFAQIIVDTKEAYRAHQEMSPLRPLYVGALQRGNHDILHCRRVGYEAAASSINKANCACIGAEVDAIAQTLLDGVHDSISELGVNTRNVSEKTPATRSKRFPAIALRVLPKLTGIIFKAARSSATRDLSIDSSIGIVKLFAKKIMMLLNKRSTVDKLVFNEAPPSRLSGKELYDIASTYPNMKYSTNKDKQIVRFMAPTTKFDAGLTSPISSAELASTLVAQARRLLDYKKRLFSMIQTGKFTPLNKFDDGEQVVSLSQTTAELVPSEQDPFHGRHVLTSLVMQRPVSELMIKPLPVYRTGSGDISFYKITPDCEHAIKAKKKHNCELRQGIYDTVQHIQIGESHLIIVTDHYKEITLECGKLPKHHLNLGVFVTNITGSFVLKLDQTKVIRSGSEDDNECKANVLVNKSLKVAAMSKTQKEIHRVLDKWNLKSLSKYRVGLVIAIILSFTVGLTLTLYVMYRGYKLRNYNKILKGLNVTDKIPEHEELIKEMSDGLREVKGKTNNILNTMITSDRLNDNISNLARGKLKI